MTFALVLAGLLLLLGLGIPIFAALGLAGAAILLVFEGSVESIADTVFAALNNPILLTIPLFVLMAQVMTRAGVVEDLFELADALIGHLRGGLGVATVLACTVFAAISGSSVACALAIGSAAIPQMQRYGYPQRQALGVVAAGGTLGILIPPSGPMILYAVVSDASIGALFMAGLIPGLMLALIFALWCMIRAGRDVVRKPFAGWSRTLGVVRRALPAVLMPPVVLGGIYLGVVTASEAAAIGVAYAFAVALLAGRRRFGWHDLLACLSGTLHTSVMVLAIIAGAAIFGHAITIIRLPSMVAEAVAAMGLGQTGFLMLVMGMIFVMGMFLESIAIILITTPILLPALIALDINLIWYGILLMVNLELAQITPPVGMNLFVIKGISGAPLQEVILGAAPYVALMLLALAIILALPGLATWLPIAAGYRI